MAQAIAGKRKILGDTFTVLHPIKNAKLKATGKC
jgi:hypothetical protein